MSDTSSRTSRYTEKQSVVCFCIKAHATLIRPPLRDKTLQCVQSGVSWNSSFFVFVCVACSCCLVWWVKMWGVSLSVSASLWLLFALAQSHQGIDVTLTGIKQDTALRQRQMWAGMSYFSIMPAAFFLLVATLPRPASINLCVSLPALSQEGVRRETETHAVLPPRGGSVYCIGRGSDKWL